MRVSLIVASCAGAICLAPALGTADQSGGATFIYEEPVGGVYTQGWYAQLVDNRDRTAQHLYVTGDGKLGDFHGIISVDCNVPSRSQWLATGGYLSADAIPAEAISGIRQLACPN